MDPNHWHTGSSRTDRQNVYHSAHTSTGPGHAFATEDNLNPEIMDIEQQMNRFQSRAPPTRPAHSQPNRQPQRNSTQSHTPQHSEAQTQMPAVFAQGSPVATAPQPRTQTNRASLGQTQTLQMSHGQTHVPHGQVNQVPHGQTHQVPHGQQSHQVSHGQMHQVPQGQTHQVPQGQTHQVPHGQTHQVSHGQTHQVPHGQTHRVPHGQPHQVPHGQAHHHGQMFQATEGGTSSHDQQRSSDQRRKRVHVPAVTANQPTTSRHRQ